MMLQWRCGLGCSHGKAWLVLRDLLSGWFTHMAFDRFSQFPTQWAYPQDCLNVLTTWQFAYPRESDLKIQDGACSIFYEPLSEVTSIIFIISYCLLIWTKCWCLQNSYIEVLIPNVMVLDGGTSGRELGLDQDMRWSPLNGIGILI